MKITRILTSVFAGIALMAGISSCNIYNNLVELDEQVSAQWAQVENQYQRRYDLIPNLVSTVKGAASHETELYSQRWKRRRKMTDIAFAAWWRAMLCVRGRSMSSCATDMPAMCF